MDESEIEAALDAEMARLQAYTVLLVDQRQGGALFEAVAAELFADGDDQAGPIPLIALRDDAIRLINAGAEELDGRRDGSNDRRAMAIAALPLLERQVFLAATLLDLMPGEVAALLRIEDWEAKAMFKEARRSVEAAIPQSDGADS